MINAAAGGGEVGEVGVRPADAGLPEANWLRPSPRLRLVRRGQLVVATGPVLIAGVIVAAVASGATAAVAVGVGVLVLAGIVDVFLGRRVRAWAYAERDDDLLVQRGVMIRRLSVVPYGRMQYVDVTAGPVERAFGLATVRMHTAAAASDARVPGLPAAEAARLRDNLTALGESRAAGL
jgi:membrane protein YdbS with pleckstrin-like domain